MSRSRKPHPGIPVVVYFCVEERPNGEEYVSVYNDLATAKSVCTSSKNKAKNFWRLRDRKYYLLEAHIAYEDQVDGYGRDD